MDKLDKFLKGLSSKDALRVKEIIALILSQNDSHLDVKKLSGFNDVFRVRVQDIRIIYRRNNSGVFLVGASRRNEKTYKKF